MNIATVEHPSMIHRGHYGIRYGDVSNEESPEMPRTEKVSDEMAKTLADGFGVLIELLKALGTPGIAHALTSAQTENVAPWFVRRLDVFLAIFAQERTIYCANQYSPRNSPKL